MKILQNNKIKCLILLILYIILIYVVYMFNLPVVAAATPSGWGYDVSQPNFAGAYDCAATQCNVSLDARSINVTSSNFYYSTYNQTSLSANGYGYMWVYLPDIPLYNTNLYSVTSYICGETNYSNLVFKGLYSSDTLSNVYGKVTGGTVYYSQVVNGLNPYPYGSQNGAMYACSYVTAVYKPNNSSKYVGINVTTDMNSNNYSSALIGYKIESLGSASNLSSSDIQNIINNSGLATSSDISSLNSAISNIQNQISSNITSAQNNINNNIDDAESNIINNNNQNRQAIIDNQNDNTNKEIDSQKVCIDTVLKYSQTVSDGYFTPNGSIVFANNWGVTDYLEINRLEILNIYDTPNVYSCFYDSNKTLISCIPANTSTGSYSLPNNTKYSRFSIRNNDVPEYKVSVCKNGNQALNDTLGDLDTKITDAGVTGGIGIITGWFDDFNSGTFGLSSIITAPLSLIQSITSKTCSPLQLNIPFVNQTMELPCMTSIYSQFFGSFLTLYQTVTFGITSYWICVRLLNLVKDFKNPDHDEIEVMDL